MTTVLCLTDRRGEAHALAGVRDGHFTVLAATDLADDLQRLVEHLAGHGAPARQEHFSPGRLEVAMETVTADHPLFLDAAADAIRERSHQAVTFEEPRARAWFHLKTMPFEDAALRKLLLVSLPNLGAEEIDDLLHQLETTAAELAAIDRRLDEALSRMGVGGGVSWPVPGTGLGRTVGTATGVLGDSPRMGTAP